MCGLGNSQASLGAISLLHMICSCQKPAVTLRAGQESQNRKELHASDHISVLIHTQGWETDLASASQFLPVSGQQASEWPESLKSLLDPETIPVGPEQLWPSVLLSPLQRPAWYEDVASNLWLPSSDGS